MVEESDIIVHEADEPDAVVDFGDAKFLTSEDLSRGAELIAINADAFKLLTSFGLAVPSDRKPAYLGNAQRFTIFWVVPQHCIQVSTLLTRLKNSLFADRLEGICDLLKRGKRGWIKVRLSGYDPHPISGWQIKVE